MSTQTLVPVKGEPGVFFNKLTGKKIHIVDWREDDKYDTVFLPPGPIQPGTSLYFFRDLQGKNLIDTNFSAPRKLPAGEEMILNRIGVQIPLAIGNVLMTPGDIKKVAENGYLAFRINRKDVAEGPLLRFPSGYGLSGSTNVDNDGTLSIGVPSTAAAAKLARDQYVNSDHDMDGVVTYYDRAWMRGLQGMGDPNDDVGIAPFPPVLERGVAIRLVLHGLIKAAATK